YFVTELLGTDLHRLLTSRPLEKQFIQYFLYQILRGLKYVHSAGVVHRDLIMLTWQKYDVAVDIWSTGCIFAEMLEGKASLPWKGSYLLGTPPDDTLRFVQSLPKRQRVPFSEKLRCNDESALDLLEKMLVFDPRKRINATECLSHEYVSPYHDPTDEPVAAEKFDWSFNDADLPVDSWKVMMYAEILEFHEVTTDSTVPNGTVPEGALAVSADRFVTTVTDNTAAATAPTATSAATTNSAATTTTTTTSVTTATTSSSAAPSATAAAGVTATTTK
ncbi:kinase-like domain-containing protein, partial [Lactarius sanguifluus]